MKEIGGYFGLEQLVSHEFYPDLVAVNNARSALLYILKARNIKKLYLPYFLCDSVSEICDREGYSYEYYHIDRSFMPVFVPRLSDGEYLYIVNFYGQISNEQLFELKNKYVSIIVDNVQAFFQKPVRDVDTVYSCRKFFGVPDGGYVSTDAVLNEPLELDVSKDRMNHILGRFEGSASNYYQEFNRNNRSFTDLPLRRMSELTHNILGAIDYVAVCNKREANYMVLENVLSQYNRLKLIRPIGPYAYPFYCENGMEVKKKLAEKKIYVPTLWPNVVALDGTLEKDYAENILPLPCDQRYTEDDMKYMSEIIEKLI